MQVTNSAGSSKKDVGEHIMLTCQPRAGGSRCLELRPQSHIGTRAATSSMLASCRTLEVAIMTEIMMIMMMVITDEDWRVDGHHCSRG